MRIAESCIDLTTENAEDTEVLTKIYFLFSAHSATSAVNPSLTVTLSTGWKPGETGDAHFHYPGKSKRHTATSSVKKAEYHFLL
jgi:hypothetical protein